MSKDKGSKNTKKAPADKSLGKKKDASTYKSEGKSGQPIPATATPKPETKAGKPSKS
jgi:hypothetical protein